MFNFRTLAVSLFVAILMWILIIQGVINLVED